MNRTNTEPAETSTRERIDALVRHEGGLCLSLYLPISPQPPESDKNVTRLQNLLREARQLLALDGMRENAIEDFLSPIEDLAANPEKLLRTSRSVGLFRTQDSFDLIDLPYRVDPQCQVSDRFAIRPLLDLRNVNRDFLVVCLNRQDIRAFEGDRSSLKSVDIPDMPGELIEVTGIDDPEKSLQHHTAQTVSAEGRPGTGIASVMHGHGLPNELEDNQLERFFREVAKAIDAYLSGKKLALVLVGVDPNLGRIRSVHDWSGQELFVVSKDPGEWNLQKVHEHAWAAVEPSARDEETRKNARLSEAANKGELIEGVADVALAAATSRVDLAAVSAEQSMRGVVDADHMEVHEVVEGDAACAGDLFDFIASETIRHGGEVAVLEDEAIPGKSAAVALKRF